MTNVQIGDACASVSVSPQPPHPQPQFQRETCLSLNGQWEFAFDDANVGLREQWHRRGSLNRTITVPFAFQSAQSGIGDPHIHDVVWYRKAISIPSEWMGQRIILHFGAVDYAARVWINGELACVHEGGHTPFHSDITDFLDGLENIVTVRAEDASRDLSLPRGKQYWGEHSESIFYTRTTGIWQSVWLEAVNPARLHAVQATPDIDQRAVRLTVDVGDTPVLESAVQLQVEIFDEQRLVARTCLSIRSSLSDHTVAIDPGPARTLRLWSPEDPHLYDVKYSLIVDDRVCDVVSSYVGMRKIAIEQGRVFLNNSPYYMRLVLDQGYYPDSNLTPPDDRAIRRDIELTKELGFNGVRKHQKIEDPRYLYWCDRLGLLVWGEMANAFAYSAESVARLTAEWQEVVRRDYNHPCIIAWVPLNESWGVPHLLSDPRQRAFLASLYHLTKALDSSRPVMSNDGWEHVTSDLCTIHDYEANHDVLIKRYTSAEIAVASTPGNRLIHAPGSRYRGEPILITEMGGISFKTNDWSGWGYSRAESEDDFIQRYAAVLTAIHASPVVQGFCYTQLTDVEQEINGLLTFDRKPKAPIHVLRAITEGRGIPVSREEEETP